MADEENSARWKGKGVVDDTISLDQLPLKKRNQNLVSQFKIPGPPNSMIDLYVNRSGEASGSQQQQPAIKKPDEETPHVDIYEYLGHLELEARRRSVLDYIDKGVQKDFTSDVRSVFVDWLVKVAEKCKLRSDLVHLTISCIDRYLSVNAVDRKRLQPLGVASMLISLKYEYKGHPCANDLRNTTGSKCTTLEVVKMEYEILKSLEFEIGNPTVNMFLRKFMRVALEEDEIYNSQLEFMCDYLAELSLLEYKCLKYLPSLVAASVVFLARFTIKWNLRPWSPALQQESGYEPENLKECVLLINDWKMSRKGGDILNAVRKKYKQPEFKCVSELPSPINIPAIYFEDTRSMTDGEVSLLLARQRAADARISRLRKLKLLSMKQQRYAEQLKLLAAQKTPETQISMSEGHKEDDNETSEVDIYKHLLQLERDARRRPRPDYVENVQKDFTMDTRSMFVDWVLKVAEKCELSSDLIHLTISNADRYLSVNAVDMTGLQLVGLSSMLICLKYEHEGHPPAKDFCVTTSTGFTAPEVVIMEYEMLKSLEFEIGIPTVYSFLGKFVRAAQEEDEIYDLIMPFLAEYIAELSLLEYKCIEFLPSLVAASVVFLARCTNVSDCPPWSVPMQKETGYDPPSLKECVLLIYDWLVGNKGGGPDGLINTVINKYNKHEYKCVSNIFPPDEIPDNYFAELEDEEPVELMPWTD